MKYGLYALWVLAVAMIAPLSPAIAQVAEEPISAAVQKQTDSFFAKPLEIGQSEASSSHHSSATRERLTSVANSIQAKPDNSSAQPSVSSDLIPRDLIRTSSKVLSDSHPLEVFQSSTPNRSVGINLNKL
ncbi:hypothetical protein OsccyDRAFT_2407 [Leptolyngbyaceae cyanobacterium JSC-12]|nr:hypothetical protein OsccyDRAFT_2407 [Leptolyngbyaceae cyanobacterium JSC-12]